MCLQELTKRVTVKSVQMAQAGGASQWVRPTA
jgi:hypothetical protein